MNKRKKPASMKKRIKYLIACIFIIGFIPIIANVINVGLLQHETLQAQAVEQQTRNTIISPKRGTIYDTNMKPLAESATVETCFLSPATIPAEQKRLVAQKLSEILGVDFEKTYEQTQKDNQYEVVKKKLEKADTDQIRAFIEEYDIEGVHFEEDTKRYYPYGDFLAHVLGFTGSDNQGLSGLELYYNKTLTGTKGRIVTAKDARGNALPFQYDDYESAQSGSGIVLTIDEVIQHVAERYLEQAVIENIVVNRGVALVMDVETGAVLAMAVEPDFDPNYPYELNESTRIKISRMPEEEQQEATSLALQQMWRNKAVTEAYYPGSVFKIFTGVMGLEEGVVTPDEQFYCSGSMQVENWEIHCHVRSGHGGQTFTKGVMNSCNPVFMTVAQRIGTDTFYRYTESFGFLEKTGIDLPGESIGVFHTRKNFNIVELSTAGFGQNFSVTPIQMITGISAVANGGKLMKPYIVKQYVDEEQNVVKNVEPVVRRTIITEQTSKTMSEILELVVSKGTGSSAYIPGYKVAGKTGTTEKIADQNTSGRDDLRIASFGAYAPADDPKIAVLVMLDQPEGPQKYGGMIAGPVVAHIIEETLHYMNIEPENGSGGAKKTPSITTPDLVGGSTSLEEAQRYLNSRGIAYKVVGAGQKVLNQLPRANTQMPENGTIILYTSESTQTATIPVPSVIGMNASDANSRLTNENLTISAVGDYDVSGAIAVAQTPGEGALVPAGTTVTVTFEGPEAPPEEAAAEAEPAAQ